MEWELALTRKPTTWARIFVLGGIAGAALDQVHVQSHVLRYTSPVLWGQAWWVAPNFGLATCVIYILASFWARLAERSRPEQPTNAEIALHALWFGGAYVASALLHDAPAWLAVLYVVLYAARLLRRKDALAQLGLGVCLAVGGSSAEGALSATGVFRYEHPEIWTVPLWLPGIYLQGAPLALAIVRRMRRDARADAPPAILPVRR